MSVLNDYDHHRVGLRGNWWWIRRWQLPVSWKEICRDRYCGLLDGCEVRKMCKSQLCEVFKSSSNSTYCVGSSQNQVTIYGS